MSAALLCPGAFAAEDPTGTTANEKVLTITLDPGHGGLNTAGYVDGGTSRQANGRLHTEADIALKIANAMKAELETYKNVRVYLTRTDDARDTVSGEVEWRAEYAKAHNSDLLVSLHVNAIGKANAASGACVLVTNGNYPDASLTSLEYGLGENILSRLKQLGMPTYGEGLVKRDSVHGDDADPNSPPRKYSNGKVADYYGIVYHSLVRGLPGILVEHGFMDSDADFSNFLSTDAKLAAIGKADAMAVVDYYGLQKRDGSETDVPYLTDYQNHWAHASIDAALQAGWINGYPDQTFRPNVTLNRAMFVTMLGRMDGVDTSAYTGSTFKDVAANQYYAPYVRWAVENQIVDGYPEDNTFRPNRNITREEMAKIMAAYLTYKGIDTQPGADFDSSGIADRASIAGWALDYVLFCYENGLLNGRGNGFAPRAGATRAEACVVLQRLAEYAAAQPEQPDASATPLAAADAQPPFYPDEASA